MKEGVLTAIAVVETRVGRCLLNALFSLSAVLFFDELRRRK